MLRLSTAYAPPIQYFAKLYAAQGNLVALEACETYVKQSYRNRCCILSPNGVQSLTIPVEHSGGEKIPIRLVRISAHNEWRHQHIQALATAYGSSPYFEYYWDEIRDAIVAPHVYLWDLNKALTLLLARLIDLDVNFVETEDFAPPSDEAGDWRYRIRPRRPEYDSGFRCPTYYQPFSSKHGFVGELSVLDLLFNMGPESLLVLRDSLV